MKKLILKAAVMAVVVAAPGMAMAGIITLGASPADADINVYAKELNYSVAGAADLTAADTVQTVFGYGASAGQNRYARIVLANGKFGAAVAAGSFEDTTTQNNPANSGFGGDTTATDGVTIVSGGTLGSSCVVYQLTGKAGAGNGQADVVEWTYPDLTATGTASPVTATYTLHETATSASCANIGTGAADTAVLSTPVTGDIATFASSLTFTGADGVTVTADVTTLYTEEIDVTGGALDTTQLALGIFTADKSDTNNESDNSPVDIADLITAATINVAGDFTAVGTTGTVTLSAGACNAGGVLATGTLAGDKKSVAFTGAPVLALFADGVAAATVTNLCYNTDGTTPIQADDTYSASVSFTAAAGATLDAMTPQVAGVVERDGTVLKAPFMKSQTGQESFMQLANTGTVDAAYTVRCLSTTGALAGTGGTVTAGSTKKMYQGALGCVSGTTAVELTLAVPQGSVNGAVVRQSTTTGDSAIDSMTGNL
jgi:hypothetical protein